MPLKKKDVLPNGRGDEQGAGCRWQSFDELCRLARVGRVQGMLNSTVLLPHEVCLEEQKKANLGKGLNSNSLGFYNSVEISKGGSPFCSLPIGL